MTYKIGKHVLKIIKTFHNYTHKNVNVLECDLTPYPYEHWTLKEINQQPSCVLNAINNGGRIKNKSVRLAYQQSSFCSWEKRNPAPVDQVVILQCSLRQLAEIEYKKQFNISACFFSKKVQKVYFINKSNASVPTP